MGELKVISGIGRAVSQYCIPRVPLDIVYDESGRPQFVGQDNEAQSIYVRFNPRARVAKTREVHCGRDGVITVDLDRRGAVIGIEAVGVRALCHKAQVAAPA